MIIPNAVHPNEDEKSLWTPDHLNSIIKTAMQSDTKGAVAFKIQDQVRGCMSSKPTLKNIFLGSDLVNWFILQKHATDSNQAVRLGQIMFDLGLLVHATRDSHFVNEPIPFRFTQMEPDKGHALLVNGKEETWKDLEDFQGKEYTSALLIEALKERSDLMVKNKGNHIPDMLFDENNIKMFDNVRPRNWVDPEVPDGDNKYDMVVIGGGAAGMVTAAAASIYGAKACMIERGFFGGDCLVTGCVPSKAFLKACAVAHTVKNCEEYGISIEGSVNIDFPKLMNKMKAIRAEISKADAAEKFSKYYGMDVFLGHAQFTSPNTVNINGKELKFFRACIATGARPRIPDYPGIKDIKYYTSDNIFNLTKLPESMLIIGVGPIGCELGQGFARLGTRVKMFSRSGEFLPKDDQDAVQFLKTQMTKDGVQIMHHTQVLEFKKQEGTDLIVVNYKNKDGIHNDIFETVLFATGRTPNVDGIGLDKAGVQYEQDGIKVDKYLKTTNSRIYACGDCVPGPNFTHNSDVQARIVLMNSLFLGAENNEKVILPYATYTDPEVATVGMNAQALERAGIAYDTYTKFFEHNDRALCESKQGVYTIYTKKDSDEIVGATLVGGPAGDLIGNVTCAMYNKIGLKKFGACVYPYPTYAEIFRQMTDAYNRKNLKPSTKSFIKKLIKYRS